MATWHQQRAAARLYHGTKWTVVEDPHNDCRSLTTCDTQTEAEQYRDRVKALRPLVPTYILKPATEAR